MSRREGLTGAKPPARPEAAPPCGSLAKTAQAEFSKKGLLNQGKTKKEAHSVLEIQN